MAARSADIEAMGELARLLWERYFRPKAVSELLRHSLDGYRGAVETNNGDGTLTVVRPFDNVSVTLRCPPALASSAQTGDQVLVVKLGDDSNAFVLCKTDLSGLGGGGTASEVEYDNTESGLSAENVQAAIDEVQEEVESKTIFWFGTRAEYHLLPYIDPQICYCIEEGT